MHRDQLAQHLLPPSNADAHRRLRLWLRLLTATSLMEGELRRRLRSRFGSTLPRFDLLAQLDKSPHGLTMSELSRRMMVTNGNVTALVRRLVQEGLIQREVTAEDRRQQRVTIAEAGHILFREMAIAHHAWVENLLGELDDEDVAALMSLLARLKFSLRRHETAEAAA